MPIQTDKEQWPAQEEPAVRPVRKQWTLLLLSCLSIAGFFLLPGNKDWFNTRVLAYWVDFTRQKNNLSLEHRKAVRWGNDYRYSKNIAQFFATKKAAGDILVLLPPADYFSENGVDYNVPEPAVFYYYTGLKTVWINSKNAGRATWTVSAKSGRLSIDSVTSPAILADSLLAYRRYKLPL